MLYSDSLYSQHILQPYHTALQLTTLHCLMLYNDSLYSQHILQSYHTALQLTTIHCLILYNESLYSQHTLETYHTAVQLTTTLSHAVQWQFVFTAHSTTLPYSCPAQYYTVSCCTVGVCIHSTFYNLTLQLSRSLLHCLMLYSDSLYSKHILQLYRTAVPLTTTLSHAVQWQFLFTEHSTTIPYSCTAHYFSVWCCKLTVCFHSTFYNLTVQLYRSLLNCLVLYSDSFYSQNILQPYHTVVPLTTSLSDAVN
jgi:hypothetical protein